MNRIGTQVVVDILSKFLAVNEPQDSEEFISHGSTLIFTDLARFAYVLVLDRITG